MKCEYRGENVVESIDYDLVIIGGGPAGLTAGLYAARAGIKVVLVEKVTTGGQILLTDCIENYPGFPEGLSGFELIGKMTNQAKKFNLKIEKDNVISLALSGALKKIHFENKTITARAIIIATGASPKKLEVPGEDIFFGKGVSVCATCDAPFYKEKIVAAVGGGDTAVQESLYLTKFAKKVYLIHRRNQLRSAKVLQDRAFANNKIEFVWDSVVTSINGGLTNVDNLTIENVKTKDSKNLVVDGCFIWVGINPNIDFLRNDVKLDEHGFIITNVAMETSVPGIFAAGDVRNTIVRQVATAVGDAATAAVSAERYLENLT